MTNDIEGLAREFHEIYQKEAKRQGDVRHKDSYDELPENIKEFDRVLARHVQKMVLEARIEENKKWGDWAKYPTGGASIGVMWDMATHSAVKEIKDHADERIKQLEWKKTNRS